MMTPHRSILGLAAISLVLFAGCGSNGDEGPALSATAEAGRNVARTNGCASCHGSNGEGGVGPAFAGLFGSEVPLDDGTTVTADEDYLRTSIVDPGAQKVAGYSLPMPTNNLSDDEIDQVIAYITELATPDMTDVAAVSLSPAADEGLELSRSRGCASCHGSDGQGGVAGAFVGLFGSEIELDDGSVVVADEEFLREAIVDPDKARPADSGLPMPSNNLSDEEVDRIVDYIVELADADAEEALP